MENHILLFGKFVLTTCRQPGGAPFCDRATTNIFTQTGLGLARDPTIQNARSIVIVMPWNLRRSAKPENGAYYGRQRWFTTKMSRALVIGVVRRPPLETDPRGPRSFWDQPRAERVKNMERAMDLQADEIAPKIEVGYVRQDKVGPAYSPYQKESKGAS